MMGENNGAPATAQAAAPPPLDAEQKLDLIAVRLVGLQHALRNELRNVEELLNVVNAAPPEQPRKRPRAFGQGKD